MDIKIEKLLEDYCIEKGFTKWENDNELLDILRDLKEVKEELIEKHRWWNEYEYIVKLGDTYIRYIYADTTGDMSPSEAGYDFNPDLICEMEQIEKTITTYVIKKEKVNE